MCSKVRFGHRTLQMRPTYRLNPRNYATWKWSSYKNYVSKRYDEWVEPLYTLGMSAEQYENFVIDYARVDQRKHYTQLKDILAA